MERVISIIEFFESCRLDGIDPLWTRQAKRWIVRNKCGNGYIMAIPYGAFKVAVIEKFIDLN